LPRSPLPWLRASSHCSSNRSAFPMVCYLNSSSISAIGRNSFIG
jgi:hypothetical protein